jgi:hypothetical protein
MEEQATNKREFHKNRHRHREPQITGVSQMRQAIHTKDNQELRMGSKESTTNGVPKEEQPTTKREFSKNHPPPSEP